MTSDENTEYIEEFVLDKNYTGPPSQSQACYKRGISYTPPGWKKIYRKVKRSQNEDTDSHNSPKKKLFRDEKTF